MASSTVTTSVGLGSAGRIGAAYTESAMWFHWVTAILMALIVPIAWVMTNLPEHAPIGGLLYMLHKSLGLTILAIVVLRLGWRARHPAPPLSGRVGAVIALTARASHWLLYAVLLAMPVSGYLLTATSNHPLSYFDLFAVPKIGDVPWLHRSATSVHLIGQWAVYALVVLHLLGTAYHVVVARDGTLDRMLPRQDV